MPEKYSGTWILGFTTREVHSEVRMYNIVFVTIVFLRGPINKSEEDDTPLLRPPDVEGMCISAL